MKAPKDIVEALRVLGVVGRKMEYRMKMIILSIRKKIIKNNKRKRMGIPMLRKAAYRKAMKNRRRHVREIVALDHKIQKEEL